MLDWAKKIGNHNLFVLGVYELMSSKYEIFKAWRENAVFDIDYLFVAPDLNKGNTGSGSEDGRIGYVFRANYDFKNKYLAEFNSRYDASPRFPEDGRWGSFPSFSVGWRISEEDFIKKNLPDVDNLKLRASYGQLGYDNVGDFQYLSTYKISSKYLIDGVLENGVRIANISNPNITWEKMTTKNVGLDLSMWKNKLSVGFDYFYRLRSNVLGKRSVSMPDVVGASLPSVNYAKYGNRGFELDLEHSNRVGELTYSIGANLTWTREKTILVDESSFGNEEERRRGEKSGKWTNRWWGFKSDGLFQSEEEIRNWADQDGKNNATILPGDIKLVDLNGDGMISNDDQTMIGRSSFPELMFGLNIDIDYKSFYLYFTLSENSSDGGYYNMTAYSKSTDLVFWTYPKIITPKDRYLNFSSPGNIVRYNDEWVICFQTYPTPKRESFGNANSRIFIMRSKNLEDWGEPELLKVKGDDVPESEMGRMIDPYLTKDEKTNLWWCFYKQNGVSMSYSHDLENWTYAGHCKAGENVTILKQGDEYVMFHSPSNGIGIKRSKALDEWGEDIQLLILNQANWEWAKGRLTAATAIDLKNEPGINKNIMFFHGDKSGEVLNRAHKEASLAIAWSDDLINWYWPGKIGDN